MRIDGTSTFSFRIDSGDVQEITVASGIYMHAVAAIPAFFEVDMPCIVEIWVPSLLPQYGPYHYRLRQDTNSIKADFVIITSTEMAGCATTKITK